MTLTGTGADRSATLGDIAQLVGVSTSAASMALRDHPRISESTKERVHLAARELGYVANSAGRALRAQRSGSIALLVPNTGQHVFGHVYFMHLLAGVSAVSNENDAPLIVSTNPDEEHGVAAYQRILRSRAADGVIVASAAAADPHLPRLVESGLPVVLVGRFPTLPESVSVGVDDLSGGQQATDHLLREHARSRIAHISGPPDHQSAIDRYAGYRRALRMHGDNHAPLLATGDYSEASGAVAARELLAAPGGFDAMFAANDEMAYGAICELGRHGFDVPGDVAVVGFDDFGLARVTTPAISTVRVPAEALGRAAARLLFDLIGGAKPVPTHQTLSVDLVARQSCGCAPAPSSSRSPSTQ